MKTKKEKNKKYIIHTEFTDEMRYRNIVKILTDDNEIIWLETLNKKETKN